MRKLSFVTALVLFICSGQLLPLATVSAASTYPVNVYRFYSPTFDNAHFYTTNEDEALNLIDNDSNWEYEGVAFGAYENDIAGCESHTAVYRFWSSTFKTHFFTIDVNEKNSLIAGDHNWWYEGVAYCADTTQVTDTYPLYRFWSPNYHKHFFTGVASEKDYLISTNPNWHYEGVAYYVPKSF